MTATPNPAFAVAASGRTYVIQSDSEDEPDEVVTYPWRAAFTVTVVESAGVGLDVTFVNLTVNQASGGIVTPPRSGEIEHYEFDLQATGNRVDAYGSTTLNFDVWYDLPNGGREALVTVSVSYTDDADISTTRTVQVRLQ
jgi:hypothetical protein